MIEGQGTYTFANGDVYAGHWRYGTHSGKGTYTFADGSEKSGYWHSGTYGGPNPEDAIAE